MPNRGKPPFETMLMPNQARALASSNPISESREGLRYRRYNTIISIIDEDVTQSLGENERLQDFVEVSSPEVNPTEDPGLPLLSSKNEAKPFWMSCWK